MSSALHHYITMVTVVAALHHCITMVTVVAALHHYTTMVAVVAAESCMFVLPSLSIIAVSDLYCLFFVSVIIEVSNFHCPFFISVHYCS